MGKEVPYYQATFPTDVFKHRRDRICESIGDAYALLQGAPAPNAMEVFRQFNDFYYLSGIEVPHAYLLIDGNVGKTTAYLPPQDKHLQEIEGPELSSDNGELSASIASLDAVKPLDALKHDLSSVKKLYVPRRAPEGRQTCQDSIRDGVKQRQNDPWADTPKTDSQFPNSLVDSMSGIELLDLSPLLVQMRRYKEEVELEVMRRAGRLTAMALCEAVRCTRRGITENQLASVAEYIFTLNGAMGGAYRPIIASGENIWRIHYFRNNCQLKSGDLVLFDYAPDLDCYTSDIGRMWPVSGTYESWQRELYSFVVDYHLTVMDLIAPGKTGRQIRQEASEKLLPIATRTKWSKPQYRAAIEKLLATSKSLTHTVGMAVHDESGYQKDDYELQPGLVFALDPQLWVPEEKLYFRVEDCVVVTDNGVENLTPDVPYDPNEMEALMREPGLFELRPDLFLPEQSIM